MFAADTVFDGIVARTAATNKCFGENERDLDLLLKGKTTTQRPARRSFSIYLEELYN